MKKMKKALVIGLATLTLSSIATPVFAQMMIGEGVWEETSITTPDTREIIFVNSDSLTNTSYQKSFTVDKSNGENLNISLSNSNSSVKVWLKVKVDGSYTLSTILEPGESKNFRRTATNGKYEVTVDSVDGGKMNASLKIRQY